MTVLHFVTRHADGSIESREVQAAPGKSARRAALAAGIAAIAADCGGLLTCATCHVYVAPEWAGKLPPPSADELGMLEFTAAPRRETSRLSCQIRVGPDIEGLTVELPERQY